LLQLFYSIHNINSRLKGTNRGFFVLVQTASLFICALVFNFFYIFFGNYDAVWFEFPNEKEPAVVLIAGVIAAPLFETWFNQSLPYSLLNKLSYFRKRKFLILLISAVWFGLNHFYSLFYIIYGCLIGLVLMYGYMVRIKSDSKTFYLVAISHSLVNLGIFFLSLVE
jgi:hypothetical protein